MRNIALEVSYDGTRYSGWQVQDNALTIQGVIEDALTSILKEPMRITYAGRTDAGVHAIGQVIAFKTKSTMTEEQFALALNSVLPDDIRIMKAFAVPLRFHPRYSAQKRWYRYIIWNAQQQVPFFHNYSLWVKWEIDLALLAAYCRKIIGTQNFTSFATVELDENPMRNVYVCEMYRKGDFIVFDIIANSFLRKMVRTIIGTFLELERERAKPEAVEEIIRAERREMAGETVYAGGLYLAKVFY